jgi:hypothetical protein
MKHVILGKRTVTVCVFKSWIIIYFDNCKDKTDGCSRRIDQKSVFGVMDSGNIY